jgi:hypothetical protein
MKGMSTPQWILFAIFIIYFIFPMQFPSEVYQALESIPGMIFVFCFIVYLFLYSHPVLGIFALLAAYEFFYYSTSSYSPSTRKTAFLEYAPKQAARDIPREYPVQIQQFTESEYLEPEQSQTQSQPSLEEEMVQNMAPVINQDTNIYINTRFQPVADSVGSASIYV